MKSFSLLRTNTGLTTNVKVVVASDYKLYLESFNSIPELSTSRYKKFQFNKNNYYDELVPYFFKNTSTDVAYSIKYDEDNDKMFNSFSMQYDDIYQMGCRNISDNKDYIEEFECLAPLYLFSHAVPKYFVILRTDGPGLQNLSKDNFRSEIVDKFKCIKLFDLTKTSPLGEWINNNFINNASFPATPFELDYRKLEFSKWNGIDFESGGYSSKSFFMDEVLETENTFHDLQKTVFDGYKNNKVIFPNIINFSFLFDDTPATPTSLRKWSINRYYGFYLNEMDLDFCVTPYTPPALRPDVIVKPGNILCSQSGSNNPFEKDFKNDQIYYVEYLGNFYKIEQYTEKSNPQLVQKKVDNVISESINTVDIPKYRIISDIDLSGKQSDLNKKIITIDAENKIKYINGSIFDIPNYDYADLWLMNIDGVNHVIKKNISGEFFLQTDYGFSLSVDKYSYYINDPDPNYRKTVSLIVDKDNAPKNFKIYRCQFTDIKDFDTQIVNTQYSKFEYDINNQLVKTDETKMYTTDLRSVSNPKDLNDYVFNNEVVHIPCSSEFTATGELFEIKNDNLTDLWRKNSTFCKWGFQNSISSSDYPYMMNNSSQGEDYNRTINPFYPQPSRVERNLDYYYSVNSGTTSYSFQTLNINGESFDFYKYLGFETVGTASYSYDYFSYFFSRPNYYDSGNLYENTYKYSNFNIGDNVIPNITLFRGIKFNIYDVSTIKPGVNNIENINLISSNSYNDYKFSILLTKNAVDEIYDAIETNKIVGLTDSTNNIQWKIIDNWKLDTSYLSGTIVSYNDVLYTALIDNTISDPTDNPALSSNWSLTTSTAGDYPLWSPNITYTTGQWVYNNGEYYTKNSSSTGPDFWSPEITYGYGSYSIFGDSVWQSMTASNNQQPSISLMPGGVQQYWSKIALVSATASKWDIIQLWSPSKAYSINEYVVYNNVLYGASQSSSGETPSLESTIWTRHYSIEPDTNYIYGTGSVYTTPSSNNIIKLNNRYYLCTSNSNSNTLDNGITIYVNKLWKNILINIYINDNTYSDTDGCARDVMYTDLHSKLTASNFISCINDLTNKYGFSDNLRYIVIDNDGIKSYTIENIKDLPVMLIADYPDAVNIKLDSLIISPSSINSNLIKPNRKLDNAKISNIDQLNYYNNIPLGVSIKKSGKERALIDNYSSLKNELYNNLYRHSGYYMPIFYEIALFNRPSKYGPLNGGNYKFDTSLTNFGIMKERIISKVNRNGTILKLKNNSSVRSIYPMLDEFGYTFVDFFIFKSNWDYEYFYECFNISDTTNQNNTQ